MRDDVVTAVECWVREARSRLEYAAITREDLDVLARLISSKSHGRQDLLYLHAATPSIHSAVIGETLHSSQSAFVPEIEATPPPRRYETVHEAIRDGWWVVHFPDQRLGPAGVMGTIGYEFILEKRQP
jgi:hypothetical protein